MIKGITSLVLNSSIAKYRSTEDTVSNYYWHVTVKSIIMFGFYIAFSVS